MQSPRIRCGSFHWTCLLPHHHHTGNHLYSPWWPYQLPLPTQLAHVTWTSMYESFIWSFYSIILLSFISPSPLFDPTKAYRTPVCTRWKMISWIRISPSFLSYASRIKRNFCKGHFNLQQHPHHQLSGWQGLELLKFRAHLSFLNSAVKVCIIHVTMLKVLLYFISPRGVWTIFKILLVGVNHILLLLLSWHLCATVLW